MKKYLIPILCVLLSVSAFAGATKKTMPYKPGNAVEKLVTTYAQNTTDTVIVTKDPAAQAFSFSYYNADSSNVTNVVLQRLVDGKVQATAVGDTLAAADSSATAKLRIKSITLAPQCDQFYILVKYKANTNSLDQGVTTPTAVYQITKQFSK